MLLVEIVSHNESMMHELNYISRFDFAHLVGFELCFLVGFFLPPIKNIYMYN